MNIHGSPDNSIPAFGTGSNQIHYKPIDEKSLAGRVQLKFAQFTGRVYTGTLEGKSGTFIIDKKSVEKFKKDIPNLIESNTKMKPGEFAKKIVEFYQKQAHVAEEKTPFNLKSAMESLIAGQSSPKQGTLADQLMQSQRASKSALPKPLSESVHSLMEAHSELKYEDEDEDVDQEPVDNTAAAKKPEQSSAKGAAIQLSQGDIESYTGISKKAIESNTFEMDYDDFKAMFQKLGLDQDNIELLAGDLQTNIFYNSPVVKCTLEELKMALSVRKDAQFNSSDVAKQILGALHPTSSIPLPQPELAPPDKHPATKFESNIPPIISSPPPPRAAKPKLQAPPSLSTPGFTPKPTPIPARTRPQPTQQQSKLSEELSRINAQANSGSQVLNAMKGNVSQKKSESDMEESIDTSSPDVVSKTMDRVREQRIKDKDQPTTPTNLKQSPVKGASTQPKETSTDKIKKGMEILGSAVIDKDKPGTFTMHADQFVALCKILGFDDRDIQAIGDDLNADFGLDLKITDFDVAFTKDTLKQALQFRKNNEFMNSEVALDVLGDIHPKFVPKK